MLWDISFEARSKEITCVIGPNGAGKTTLLKTIAGLLRPYRGTIRFLGKNIEGLPAHKIVELGIALVPQGRELFPYMTVLENLKLGAYLKRAKEYEKDSLELVFQLFPVLKERKNQIAATLSGGEQQMLAIARALMSRPKLLMLDEPSMGLAPKVVQKVYEVIYDLNKQGMTILLVEQNIYQALQLSNKAYVIENGRILMSGEGKDLLGNEYIKKAYLSL